MSARQIPNLAPAVFLSPTAQLEIVQDGVSLRASAGQIAGLASVFSLFKVENDILDNSVLYPTFIKVTSGSTDTIYTSDPKYNYIPADGLLSVLRPEATQGIVFNNSVTSLDYTFPSGDNATSCGPLSVSAVITVPAGSEWAIL